MGVASRPRTRSSPSDPPLSHSVGMQTYVEWLKCTVTPVVLHGVVSPDARPGAKWPGALPRLLRAGQHILPDMQGAVLALFVRQ